MKRPKQRAAKLTPGPEPMIFEHVPVPERPYDRIANRVLAAIEELNNALEEAHECPEMRVFIGAAKPEGRAMKFEPQIYSLTHSTLTYTVKFKDDPAKEQMEWRQVKDPKFKDASGQGLRALKESRP